MTVRLAHVSDIHFGTENEGAVQAAADWAHRESPDLIVVTGDLTAFGQPEEFERAAEWVRGLPGERLVVPGNHDTPYLAIWSRLTAPFSLYQRWFGTPDGLSWRGEGIAVAGVNTARGMQPRLNWSKGAIGATQVERALSEVARERGRSLGVVACHHPLAEMVGGPMTARVRGGERAARRFCEGGVDLILTGHIHVPFAMALPHADHRTYAVGAGTLSIRERGAPAGFNSIEIDERQVRVRALAWTGSRFDLWREWELERRSQSG